MHLLKAIRTQQVPQEVWALLALRQLKVSRVPTGKCIIFKHAQKRCCIAELFLDFVFAHERKPIKPEIYRKFTKPLYSCLNVFQGKKTFSKYFCCWTFYDWHWKSVFMQTLQNWNSFPATHNLSSICFRQSQPLNGDKTRWFFFGEPIDHFRQFLLLS